MTNFTPQEVSRFKEWLNYRKDYIKGRINNNLTKNIIDMTFEILQAELNCEFEASSNEMIDKMGHDQRIGE